MTDLRWCENNCGGSSRVNKVDSGVQPVSGLRAIRPVDKPWMQRPFSRVAARRRWVGTILSVFGDESADEAEQRVFAVSGVVGSDPEWENAEIAWLDRTGGIVFHAARCEYEKNFELYKDLTQILAKAPVAGIAFALDLVGYREFFPNALPDTGYYTCFIKVINAMASMARKWNERVLANPACGDPTVRLEFAFDHRPESEESAGRLYSTFINQPEWRESILLDTKISFESRKNPRIQMADLVAHEAMKELDRKIGPTNFPRRKSLLALEEREHFRFVQLDREYCSVWRDRMTALGQETGFTPDTYRDWLSRTGRVQHGHPHDNWYNRAMFLAWLDSRDELSR